MLPGTLLCLTEGGNDATFRFLRAVQIAEIGWVSRLNGASPPPRRGRSPPRRAASPALAASRGPRPRSPRSPPPAVPRARSSCRRRAPVSGGTAYSIVLQVLWAKYRSNGCAESPSQACRAALGSPAALSPVPRLPARPPRAQRSLEVAERIGHAARQRVQRLGQMPSRHRRPPTATDSRSWIPSSPLA